MSSQSQSQFFPRSAVVQELEERLTAPGKHPEVAATYQQLCRDPAVVLAVRYLALSAIANKLNLYSERGSANGLIQEISEHMNAVDPHKLLTSIQHLKSYYPSLYRMNTLAFDTAANTAVDCIHRVAPQNPAVSAPVTDFAQPPVAAWGQSPPPMDFAQPLVTVNNYPSTASSNRAILMGGSIVASSIVAGTLFLLGRGNSPQLNTTVVSPSASPSNIPTMMASAASSPVAMPSVVATVLPSSAVSPVPSPSQYGSLQRRSNVQPSTISVAPIPVPTRVTSPAGTVGAANIDRSVVQERNRLKVVPPVNASSSTAANRPSATGFISSYYTKLKSGQFQSAWQDLTTTWQGNRRANPGGYGGEYAKWWGGLGQRTQVGKIEMVKMTPETAVVQAHCRYGRESYVAEYYLAFDAASQSWKIDRIKKLS